MHQTFMKEALRLAARGSGHVNPNPKVGAVLVKNGTIIAGGWHEWFGGPHAEVNAIASAGNEAAGATLYVTLEPCSHRGKTPPCVDLIIEKGIRDVVVAMEDPNPLVSGRGIEKLRANGITVEVGVCEQEAAWLNRFFLKFIATRRPYVVMKTAMTLDGKIATHTGDSKWISSESSRKEVHRMRHEMMGIMVGIGTVEQDDPSLTTRLGGQGTDARPILVDSSGRIGPDARVFKAHPPGRPIVATTSRISPEKIKALETVGAKVLIIRESNGKVDLDALMEQLGGMGMDSILLEGGASLNAGALEAGIVDEIVSFIAPKVIGGHAAPTPVGGIGAAAMADALEFGLKEVRRIGSDVMIRWRKER